VRHRQLYEIGCLPSFRLWVYAFLHFYLLLPSLAIALLTAPISNLAAEDAEPNGIQANLAISYGFSGGRFGDNLLSFAHAAWLSHALGVPLVYVPFPFSDRLKLHTHPGVLRADSIAGYDMQPLGAEAEYLKFFNVLSSGRLSHKTVFTLRYYPEAHEQYDAHPQLPQHLYVNWDDPAFIQLLRTYIAPVHSLPKLTLPKDRMTVALHVRKGGDFDPKGWEMSSPLIGPPDTFYIEALKLLHSVVDQPLYVFIFTDHLNPHEILEKMAAAFKGSDIIFDCRQGRPADFMEDFFSMGDFDYLIRAGSNFSLLVSHLFPFKIVVSPMRARQINKNTCVIDRIVFEMGPNNSIKEPLRVILRKEIE